MWNAQLDEAQAGIKIARRTINSLRYADDTTFMAESEEELKSLLMKVSEQSEKAGLKLNIQIMKIKKKKKIMASSPITLWQIDEETMETVTDFIFLDSKVNTDGNCSCEIKRHLLLGRKSMTNLDSVLKSRDITLMTKVPNGHAQMWESIIKKAECWRIEAFELWCWRRLVKVPWTGRRSNQSFLKEISSEYALDELVLKR